MKNEVDDQALALKHARAGQGRPTGWQGCAILSAYPEGLQMRRPRE